MSDTRWKAGKTKADGTPQRKHWWSAIPPLHRLFLKVYPRGDCWEYRGHVGKNGYGQLQGPDGRITTAHRLAYELAHGVTLPRGQVVHPDHLCRHRWCVRPSHLEVVKVRTNILRGVGATAQHAKQTHCINGHPFNAENTYYRKGRPGGRDCKVCARARKRGPRG